MTVSLTRTPVTRGRLTNKRTGEVMEFPLNPETIQWKKGSNYVTDPVPGRSHPRHHWMSGKEEQVSFLLRLDGEVSQRVLGINLQNALNPSITSQPHSVQGEIDFCRALDLPTSKQAGGDGATDVVVFNFGPMFRNWEATVEVTPINLMEFDPNLEATRAEVSVVLTRHVGESETSDKVWRSRR